MRGQADGGAGGDPPAWWAGDGMEAAEGIASLGGVDRLVRAIRAERAARAIHARRAADDDLRLMPVVLDPAGTTPEDRGTVPADMDRGSR